MFSLQQNSNRSLFCRVLVFALISILILSISGCTGFGRMLTQPYARLLLYIDYQEQGGHAGLNLTFTEFVEGVKGEMGSNSDLIEDVDIDLGDNSAGAPQTSSSGPAPGGSSETDGDIGPLKPVGFVNYGEYDATVRAYTYYPLGNAEPAPAPGASTVSTSNSGSGWPNSSRFISVPMGAYSWCIDWTPGDVDEDGDFDYFHYIQDDPTILDENSSDELESAEEVSISAPPSAGAVFEGKCQSAPVDKSCVGKSQSVQLYTSPGWVILSDDRPEVIAHANTGDFPPPAGIAISSGGGHALQKAWILYEAGHYLEATTSGDYTAIGVQPHGESAIGWARVLFDGVEVWRGDTSSYWHDGEGYLHAVYIEVRCFPPGEHTLRIEALGVEGSGGAVGSGGRIDVPIAYFGFRP